MFFKKRDKGTWDGIEKAATMGTNFVAHTVVGLVLGYYCDKWFGTEPWGLIFWLLMGIIAGFRTMYLDAMKMSRSQSLNAPSPEEKPGEKAGEAGKGEDAGKAGGGREGRPDA